MKIFWMTAVSCIAFLSTAFASDKVLQERLQKAKSGDYIVTEANKMISILAIRSSSHSLILEEITVPSNAFESRPASWSEWIRKRAPGHTSWSMVEIDLKNYQLLECYSFSRSAWVQISSQDSLISTLLSLSLEPIPEQKQRRIGPQPSDGEEDHRKIWQPPLIINGQRLQNAEFDVYRANWPENGSDLAGNTVSLYFDRDNRSPFPVWIQLETAHVNASLKVIDSGKDLPALHRNLPRRVPEFVGVPQKTQNGLRLSLKSPKYYRSFELFAIDITTREKQIYPVTHSLISGEGEILQIEIDQMELLNILKPDHRYTWLIVPTGHSEFYSESHKPFLWKE